MSEGNVEIVRSIYAAWAKGDFSVSEWADDDIEFRGGDKTGGRGTGAMARLWRDWLGTWEDFAVVPEEFIDVSDDRVLVLAQFRGRGRASGAPAEGFLGGSLFTLRDGKVVRLALYSGTKEALEAAGLSE